MKTFFDLFSGGGGAAQGAEQAGLTPIGGVEIDPAIAEVYKANHGDHLTVGDVLKTRPGQYDRPDWFHASPVCKSFSAAKTNGRELALDIACAEKVAEYIGAWEPQYFSLENVAAYAKSKSFALVLNALYRAGYFPWVGVLNAADFGVPQSRRRLIVLAVRGGFVPPLPPPTPWMGWYEAIYDLLPGLPDSRLADWQIKALPDEYKCSLLIDGRNPRNPTIRESRDPSFTVPVSVHKGWICALLVHPTDQRTCSTPAGDRPSFTVTAAMPQTSNYPRALLIENTGARSDRPLQIREQDQPCWTLRAMGHDGHWHRANAWECGRIVRLDISCLARLQSFPDDYRWSGRNVTDGTAIGNSVCPVFFEQLIRAVMEVAHA